MEGLLNCQIGFSTQKYYFILHDSVLLYCKKKGNRVIGQIHLSIAKVEKRECQINITTGIEKIILLFENNFEKDVWFDCIQKQNQKLHLEDELEKVRSLQYQFESTLKFVNKTIEQNPNLNSYSERLQSYGSIFIDKLSEIVDLLYQSAQPEFQSCQSINSIHTQSLKPAPLIKKSQKLKQQQFNVWGNVKNHILNNNIYNMKLPIYLHQPSTMLQQVATQMKYISILDRASSIRDPDFKIALIFGFLISQYSSIPKLLPLPSKINETFEIVDTYKYLSQQINENTIAFYATSPSLDYNGQIEYQFSFDNLILDINLVKSLFISFKKNLDTYKIYSTNHFISIKNLVTQKPEIVVEGNFIIDFKGTQYEIQIRSNQIKAVVGQFSISGTTNKLIANNFYNEELILFQKDEKEFEFNKHNPLLPPSDSRFRSDLISMLEGNYYEAQQEKDRMIFEGEFLQSWFNPVQADQIINSNEKRYDYKGGYFTQSIQ
ncbi:unnamed protein product [Paramecium primaurelia]|uniref:PH domain-containing protein n=1 Tax=Paramecium primaurelia TaxID=5886 RepID=A0A8S1N951_PARPR|nr:unnamed protein product [Paramecium primaurelia]